jgi:hypothetical protein
MQSSREKYYNLITAKYGKSVAKRSQVPLINHINEGVDILENMGASEDAIKAFIIHPLFQGNDSLVESGNTITRYIKPRVMMLVMEYRRSANSFLPHHQKKDYIKPVFDEVIEMLIADKIQNKKDFLQYQTKETMGDRYDVLDDYFDKWFNSK